MQLKPPRSVTQAWASEEGDFPPGTHHQSTSSSILPSGDHILLVGGRVISGGNFLVKGLRCRRLVLREEEQSERGVESSSFGVRQTWTEIQTMIQQFLS